MVYLITQLEEKPKTCKFCPFMVKLNKKDYKELYCSAEHKPCEGGNPIWCPLVEIK